MAKSFLSVPINQIPTTSDVSDDDYIIIESPTKGTRIIRKDDLINSGGIKAGKGVIFEDSSTLGVDFQNICSTGLSATEDQLMVNYGLGLSADASGKLFVNTTQLLSGGAPSSIKYYDAAGLSAIHTANVSGTVKHLYWTGSGVLSSIQLTTLGVPTIDAGGNVIIYNLSNASIPQQIVLNATYLDLVALEVSDAGMTNSSGNLVVSDNIGRWNSAATYDSIDGSITITAGKKINLPVGTYVFDDGLYALYSIPYTNTFAILKMYNSSDVYQYTVATSSVVQSGFDHHHVCVLKNSTPSGSFTISDATWYLQLEIIGQTGYTLYKGAGTADEYNTVNYGSIKIIKIG